MTESEIVSSEEKIEVPIKKRVQIDAETPEVLICVYGTLRQGEINHKRHLALTKSEFLGTFKSEPRFTMYGRRAGFPMLSDIGTTSIVYEVYRISESKVLEGLHQLEGCSGIPSDPDSWYDLEQIKVPTGKNEQLEDAWIYVQRNMTSSIYGPITSGDWKYKSV